MSLPHILPGKLVGHPDLINCRAIDAGCLPLISDMERVGTAIDIEHFKSLSIELKDSMREYESQIKKYIPIDKLREFVNARGTGNAPSADDPDSFLSDKIDRDEDLDQIDPLENAPDLVSNFNLNSSEKIAWLLFDTLELGKGKNLKTSGNGKRISTGKKQLEMLKGEHEIVSLLLKYREVTKLKTTYVDKLPRIAIKHNKGTCNTCGLWHPADSFRVHTEFPITRTETGRPASRNPNLQNIPGRTKLGKRVRKGFIPTPGWVWVTADESQIELRSLAHCALEHVMIEIYKNHGDIHIETARKAFGLGPNDTVDKDMHRSPAKTVNFGVVYGMSAMGLYAQLVFMFHQDGKEVPAWLTEDWCQEFIDKWFAVYPEVKAYMEHIMMMVRRYGMVWNQFGRVRQIHGVWSVHNHIIGECLRQAGNMPIQGFAAELMKLWMFLIKTPFEGEGMIYEWLENGLIYALLTVHDELNFECDPKIANVVCEQVVLLVEYIGELLGLACPLLAEGKVIPCWEK